MVCIKTQNLNYLADWIQSERIRREKPFSQKYRSNFFESTYLHHPQKALSLSSDFSHQHPSSLQSISSRAPPLSFLSASHTSCTLAKWPPLAFQSVLTAVTLDLRSVSDHCFLLPSLKLSRLIQIKNILHSKLHGEEDLRHCSRFLLEFH